MKNLDFFDAIHIPKTSYIVSWFFHSKFHIFIPIVFIKLAKQSFSTPHLNTYVINIHVIYSNLQCFTTSRQNVESKWYC